MISEIVMHYFYIFFRYKNYQKKLFLHDPSNKQGNPKTNKHISENKEKECWNLIFFPQMF